jgi:hypothetical protein
MSPPGRAVSPERGADMLEYHRGRMVFNAVMHLRAEPLFFPQ